MAEQLRWESTADLDPTNTTGTITYPGGTEINIAGGAGSANVRWELATPITTGALVLRSYFTYQTAWASSSIHYLNIYSDLGSTSAARITITASGVVRVVDASFATVGDSGGGSLVAGTTYRMELLWDSGTLTVTCFDTDGVQAAQASGPVAVADWQTIAFGHTNNSVDPPTLVLDDIVANDSAAAAPIGPRAGEGPPDPPDTEILRWESTDDPTPTDSAGTITYPNGTKIEMAGGAGSCNVRWSFTQVDTGELTGRFYGRYASEWALNSVHLLNVYSDLGSTLLARVSIAANGQIKLVDASAGTVADSGSAHLPLDKDVRYEIAWANDTFTITAYSTSQVQLAQASGTVAQGGYQTIAFGHTNNSVDPPTLTVDDIVFTNEADDAPIGPRATEPPPVAPGTVQVSVWTGSILVDAESVAVWDGAQLIPIDISVA